MRSHDPGGQAGRSSPLDKIHTELVEDERGAIRSVVVDGLTNVSHTVRFRHGPREGVDEHLVAPRDREHVAPAGAEHSAHFAECLPRIGDGFHHVTVDDEIERLVSEREPLGILHGHVIAHDFAQRDVGRVARLDVVR